MFTNEQRKVLTELGFTFSFDLVGEVAYKAKNHWPNSYVIVCPDGEVMSMETDNIEVALGTY